MKLRKDLLEKEIQKQILDYLWTIGAYAGKTKTMGFKRGNRYCFDKYLFIGFPDITCFYKDKLYFIECKRQGNCQTPQQKIFETYCFGAGIRYILAYSINDITDVLI